MDLQGGTWLLFPLSWPIRSEDFAPKEYKDPCSPLLLIFEDIYVSLVRRKISSAGMSGWFIPLFLWDNGTTPMCPSNNFCFARSQHFQFHCLQLSTSTWKNMEDPLSTLLWTCLKVSRVWGENVCSTFKCGIPISFFGQKMKLIVSLLAPREQQELV